MSIMEKEIENGREREIFEINLFKSFVVNIYIYFPQNKDDFIHKLQFSLQVHNSSK